MLYEGKNNMIKNKLAVLITTTILVLMGCNSQENEPTTSKVTATTDSHSETVQDTVDANLPVYRIATVSATSPLISKKADGTVTGFEIELLEAIGEEQGFKPEFVIHKWKDLKSDLEGGKVDIWSAGITIKEERKKFGYFSDSYLPERVGILALDDKPNKLDKANLKHLTIGVKGNSSFVENVKKVVGEDSKKIVKFKSNYFAFEGLARKKVDAMVANEILLVGLVKQFPEFKFVLKTLPNTKKGQLGFMIQKDKPELVTEINQGLKAIKANGKFDKIKQKWLGDLDLTE